MQPTLFEKYGGFSTVSRIVLDLYDRVLDDDDVGQFFEDIDIGGIVDHQTKFVSSLMGGPASFSDDHIRRMHADLPIRAAHFERLQQILRDTLSDHRIEASDIDAIVGAFEARRELVVR